MESATLRQDPKPSEGLVVIDALEAWCPTEFDAWTGRYFDGSGPEWTAPPVPNGRPSGWTWLDGEKRALWIRYPSMRRPGEAATPSPPALAQVWRALKQQLGDGTLPATGFPPGTHRRVTIPPEAWEVLDWNGDVRSSRVEGNGTCFVEVRVKGPQVGVRGTRRKDLREWISTRTRDGSPVAPQRKLKAEARAAGYSFSTDVWAGLFRDNATPEYHRPGKRKSHPA
jgi:hypothetical protein